MDFKKENDLEREFYNQDFSAMKELLERIRDIRASEKVFYRQILEIYATSIDYDPNAEESILFFKKVQNKIHFAISGETAVTILLLSTKSSMSQVSLSL